MPRKTLRQKIDDLSARDLYSKPVHVDWSVLLALDTTTVYDAARCSECGTIRVGDSGEERCRDLDLDLDGESTCPGYVNLSGPMMNYFYPCEIDDPAEEAKKLVDTPLCIVDIEDMGTGLALTGGGMDLSWEICEAFIALGLLPPLHFCTLPSMAGKTRTAKNVLIVRACEESNRIAMRHARQGLRSLRNLRRQLDEETEHYRKLKASTK